MEIGIWVFVSSCLLVLVDCTVITSLLRKRQAGTGCNGDYIYKASQICYGKLMHLTEVPAQTDAELLRDVAKMCRSVEPSGRCFSRKMRSCGDAGLTMSVMLRNVFEYVCGEGLDILLGAGACWSHETLKDDIVECTERMEDNFKTQGYNAWCGVTRSYIRCIGREVQEKTVCTNQAATFMQELIRRSVQPAADLMNCQLQARAPRDLANLLLRR